MSSFSDLIKIGYYLTHEYLSFVLSVAECGKSRRHFTRNFGNMFTIQDPSGNPGDFPWMAAIFMSRKEDPWRVVCGGTLISPDIVLTGNSYL